MALRQRPRSMETRTGSLPWPWRAAAWLATAAAGAALALVLAHWGWRIFGPAALPLPPLEPPERWAPTIASAPVFGRVGAPPGPAPAKATTLAGDTRLLGVFAERDGAGYALFRLPDRGPVLVRSGQDVGKDVRLEAVYRDGVRLRDHGEIRDIALRVPPAASAPATAPDRGARDGAARRVRGPCRLPGARLSRERGALDRHRIAAGQLEGAAGRRAAEVSRYATTADSRRCSACAQAIG